MVEHVSIPDDGLHEPKGITGAAEGTAYIADGAGSGDWRETRYPTRSAGQGYVRGNTSVTTFPGVGDGNEVKLDVGTGFMDDTNVTTQFEMSNTGRLTFTGVEQKSFFFSSEFFLEVGGGTSQQYTLMLNQSGTLLLPSSQRTFQVNGSDPGAPTLSSVLVLEPNDWVEVWVRADTTTTDLVATHVSLKILGVL